MATQTEKEVKREHAPGERSQLKELLNSNNRVYFFEVTAVNPANLAANTEANTAVAIPAAIQALKDDNGDSIAPAAGDLCIAFGPSLEDGLLIKRADVASAASINLRLRNVTAGAIDAAAQTFTFLVIKPLKVTPI